MLILVWCVICLQCWPTASTTRWAPRISSQTGRSTTSIGQLIPDKNVANNIIVTSLAAEIRLFLVTVAHLSALQNGRLLSVKFDDKHLNTNGSIFCWLLWIRCPCPDKYMNNLYDITVHRNFCHLKFQIKRNFRKHWVINRGLNLVCPLG